MGNEDLDKKPGTEKERKDTTPDYTSAGGINYIIAIGIDKYGYKPVNNFNDNCTKDCKNFLAVLKSRYENCVPYKKNKTEPDCLLDEDATKENIEGRIKDFLQSPENRINNNLIVYFSGHGEVIEVSEGEEKGCLIPYGITAMKDDYLIANDTLKNLFIRLNVRHFLYIADACKSAAIFSEIDSNKNMADADSSGRGDKSKWAIVSSRANELSKAGKPGENSAFTSELLRILKENIQTELIISKLISDLDGRFRNEGDNQKPVGGRLSIGQSSNSGQFALRREHKSLTIDRRSGILYKHLQLFDYKDQRPVLYKIKQQKKSCTIFRGTPSCGLWHLSKFARQKAGFTISDSNFRKIAPATFDLDYERLILTLFNQDLKQAFQSLEHLQRYILTLLKEDDFVIEIRYYGSDETKDPVLPGRVKKKDLRQTG